MSFDVSRNLYIFDDSGPTVSGLEVQSGTEPEQIWSDPLGLDIGCIECRSDGCASSAGSPEEKRERAEILRAKNGPPLTKAPADGAVAAELIGVRFGAASESARVFPRPASR